MKLRLWSEVVEGGQAAEPQWRPDGRDVVLANGAYGAILHGAVCDDTGRPVYDLPLWADPPNGAVIVPEDADGRLVLLEQWRPVPRALETPATFPPQELSGHGVRSTEFPRGFPVGGETPEEAACREAEEETGRRVSDVRLIGQCNPNTTFWLNTIDIFAVRLTDEPATAEPDAEELILRRRALAPADALAAVGRGDIFCGFTQSALLCWLARAGSAGTAFR